MRRPNETWDDDDDVNKKNDLKKKISDNGLHFQRN